MFLSFSLWCYIHFLKKQWNLYCITLNNDWKPNIWGQVKLINSPFLGYYIIGKIPIKKNFFISIRQEGNRVNSLNYWEEMRVFFVNSAGIITITNSKELLAVSKTMYKRTEKGRKSFAGRVTWDMDWGMWPANQR